MRRVKADTQPAATPQVSFPPRYCMFSKSHSWEDRLRLYSVCYFARSMCYRFSSVYIHSFSIHVSHRNE